jgi:hypothetical protein
VLHDLTVEQFVVIHSEHLLHVQSIWSRSQIRAIPYRIVPVHADFRRRAGNLVVTCHRVFVFCRSLAGFYRCFFQRYTSCGADRGIEPDDSNSLAYTNATANRGIESGDADPSIAAAHAHAGIAVTHSDCR